jgi:glycosyltransferase involved in cell wall biosynthesis
MNPAMSTPLQNELSGHATSRRPDAPAPRVSICVTAYNHEAYLRECLQSLVDQASRWPFEIVVGEDCSKDGTRAIVEEFASRYPDIVRPLIHERNAGMCGNYRAVHAAARGDYVCHCDGDDRWEPGKLAAEVEFLDAHPECVAVFTNAWVIDDDGRRLGRFTGGVPATFDTSYLIQDGNFLHHSSMMYRRTLPAEVIPREGQFVDFQVYIQMARHGRFGFIDRPLTVYRTQSSASAIRHDNAGIRRLVWQALSFVEPGQASPRAMRRAQGAFLADAAYQALRTRQPARYLEWLALVRNSHRGSLWRVQGSALGALVGGIGRRMAFHLRVRTGRAKADARVFYPK